MKLYIKRKILIGLIASITIILGLGLFSYLYFNRVMEIMKLTAHSRKVQYHAEQLRSYVVEIETSQRGYGFTGDELFRKSYPRAVQMASVHLNELDSLTRDNVSQQKRVATLKRIVADRIQFAEEVMLARQENFEKAKALVLTLKGLNQMEEIKMTLEKIQAEENRLTIDRSKDTRQQFFQFVFAFLGLICSTLILLLVLIQMINANMKLRILTEDKLRLAEKETLKINKELEAFSYSVSHDLRAPLRSINGYSQMLQEEHGEQIGEEGKRFIGVIIKNAKRMGQLIDDLLAFSRLGRQDVRRTKINMDEFVRPILDELVDLQKERPVTLDIRPLGDAYADGSMIRQVWINLLSNAFKYSQKKESSHIEVGALHEANDETLYYVKDNGVGFSMEYAHKLFGVFQRLHKAEDFEGTGVGLALVKQIIDRHGGRIWAEAILNEGATFYFSLPNPQHA